MVYITRIRAIKSKVWKHVREKGARKTSVFIVNKLKHKYKEKHSYKKWINAFEPTMEQLNEQKKASKDFLIRPLISILVPTYETNEKMLCDMLDSVIAQTYDNWEICIADGGSKGVGVRKVLDYYRSIDKRISVNYMKSNEGIIGNSNVALSMCTGDYISLLDHDDTLAPFALYEIVKVINDDKADFIYSDEDKINELGTLRYAPYFKPAWSPDTIRSFNYITHFVTVKAEIMRSIGGFRKGYEGSQDHDVILRATSLANKVIHIPQILYHWRAHERSAAGNSDSKPYAVESARKAIQQSIDSTEVKGTAVPGIFYGSFRAKYNIINESKVAIIIRNIKNIKTIKQCINSIHEKSNYINYEILIVVSDSTDAKVIDYCNQLKVEKPIKTITLSGQDTLASAGNLAVDKTDAEYIIFLDSDVEIVSCDWIEAMLEHAQRKEIGVVGPKILHSDGRIQHIGIVVGMMGLADFVCKGFTEQDLVVRYICQYMSDAIRNTSALTGTCMMVNRRKFIEVGMFDFNFKSFGADINLCLKMLERGLFNVYTPYAVVINDNDTASVLETLDGEVFTNCRNNFKHYIPQSDPYYNCNFDYSYSYPVLLNKKVETNY